MMLRADSLASTHAIAAALAALARPGDVIALAGEMGAGKTAFAQGFGAALGIEEAITSPTFTLVHSHPCPGRRLTLHHADLYRLDSTADVDDLALHELAEFDGIVLVEWGDVAAASLGDHLEVRLAPDDPRVGDDVAADERDRIDHDPGDGDLGEGDLGDGDPGDGDPGEGDPEEGSPGDGEFGLDGARLIEIQASGRTWAGRWDRLAAAVEEYRC